MELSARQRGFLLWLSLAPQREAYVSNSWKDTAAELEGQGMIEIIGGYCGLLASLTPAGAHYLQTIEDASKEAGNH
jgi:hypothetical protein